MDDFSLSVAFIAGLVSFLSPCVLPLIPGFLAYLSGGASLDTNRRETFLNSVFFVLGFSSIFALLGVLLNSVLEAIAYDVEIWASRVGGVIIIFFGLYLTKLISIPFLDREHKIHITRKFNSRYFTSFLFGAAFAAGWTPCVGAALGAILGLAATAPGAAGTLLFSYALGLGLPFLLVGAYAYKAQTLITKYAHTLVYINAVFGGLLIILGILIFTQNLSLVANLSFLNSFLLK